MDYAHLNFPKLENAPEFDCFNFEGNPSGKFLWPPFEGDSFDDINDYNFNSPALLCQTNCYSDFKDLDLSGDFDLFDQNSTLIQSLYEDTVVDAKPQKTIVGSFGQYCSNVTDGGSSETLSMIQREYGASSGSYGEQSRISGRKRTAPLELDEIQKYFDFPISKAAKEMNVGLTVLKKRCRELNIVRWPHRKIKSLKSLINNVKELGLTNEIVMLEEHQRMLEKLPDMELTERTKKLRQACFKANYKKRRFLAACY